MTIGIKDIANSTGFSEATVSLALNGSDLVNENTKKIIREAAKKVGYVPNSAARNLARRKSGSIGLIIPDIENAFYASLVKYINEFTKLKGYNLLIAVSDNDKRTEMRIISNMIENRVEGVIIVPMSIPNENPDYINRLKNYSIPYIFCTDYYEELKNETITVMSDLENGMYSLAEHVIKLGYTNIVYLTGEDKVPSLNLRLKGFMRAISENKVNAEIFRLERVDYKSACLAVDEILKSFPHTDAFVCVNDMIAIGVVNTLLGKGYSIPRDKSVTGFDNIIFSKVAFPDITTVEQNIEKIAENSVNCLLGEINIKEDILIPTKVVVRNSLENKNLLRD